MTYRSALIRALATFIIGASAAPGVSALVDISTLQAAAVAGLIAVWNLVVRSSQAWLDTHPEVLGRLAGDDTGQTRFQGLLYGLAVIALVLVILWFFGVRFGLETGPAPR